MSETLVHLKAAMKSAFEEEKAPGAASAEMQQIGSIIKKYHAREEEGLAKWVDDMNNRRGLKKATKPGRQRTFWDPSKDQTPTTDSPLGQNVAEAESTDATKEVEARLMSFVSMSTEQILHGEGNLDFIKEQSVERGFGIDLTLSDELIVNEFVNAVAKANNMARSAEAVYETADAVKEKAEEALAAVGGPGDMLLDDIKANTEEE